MNEGTLALISGIVYILFNVLIIWLSSREDKKIYNCGRVAWNPETGKYAYPYKDDNEEKWIDAP